MFPLSGRRLNISAENDCRRLHCSLRDLSSLLQAVGRLAEYFIGEIFAARFSDALAVVERLVLWYFFEMLKKGIFLWKINTCIHFYWYCSISWNVINQACVHLSRLVEVTCYGSQTSLYDLETAVPSVLKPDLIDV